MNFGDYTKKSTDIAKRSYEIVSKIIKGNSYEDIIRRRVVIATGNVKTAKLIVFKNNAVEAGINALRDRAKIVCDVDMVKAGVRYGNVISAVNFASDDDETRVYSGFMNIKEEILDAVVVIGNAPSGAFALLDIIKTGIKPRLIVATPVGFVNAAKVKFLIRKLPLPNITCRGSVGGSAVAVSIINTLLDFATCGTQ